MYTVGKDPKRTNTSGLELTGDKQQHLGKKVLGLCGARAVPPHPRRI